MSRILLLLLLILADTDTDTDTDTNVNDGRDAASSSYRDSVVVVATDAGN